MPRLPELAGENGAVIVTFAISLVLLMLLSSFAIDTTNFFRHKRQLQTQADAAALAGGSELDVGCTSDQPVFDAATRFAGVSSSAFNRPGGDAGTVTRDFVTPAPCAAGALEVKVTESGVKWFFPITAVVGVLRDDLDIAATARVELKKIAGKAATLPIALEEETPVTAAWAWLVDDATGERIDGTVRLLREGTTSGQTTRWSTDAPIVHDVKRSDLGVRVAVDYARSPACAAPADVCTTLCGAAAVKCYDGGSAGGLLHVHGFEQVPAVTAGSPPALEDVKVQLNAPCAGNPYFSAPGCTYTVTATVDWDDRVDGDAVTMAEAEARGQITGTVGGVPVTLRPSGNRNTWVGATGAVAAAGPAAVELAWVQEHGSISATRNCGRKTGTNGQTQNNPGGANTPQCKGVWQGDKALGQLAPATATAVHRVFVRSAGRSGPITYAAATEGGAIAQSVPRCDAAAACPHAWTIDVDLPAPLKIGSRRNLTVKSPGSNGGFLDCDPLQEDPTGPSGGGTPRFVHQIATGCNGPRFAVNPGTTCPPISSYGEDEPWICVASATGEHSNALLRGFNRRLYGSENPSVGDCAKAPNRMRDGFVARVPQDDPRVISVMIVPNGSLATGGGSLFPVRVFAFFYLTGYDGHVRCPDMEPSRSGDVLGYFINHAIDNDGSVYGTQPCTPGELDGCVPVMTK